MLTNRTGTDNTLRAQLLGVLAALTIVWTVIPWSLTATLPRDTLEALYWGLRAGWTTPKHPPLASVLADSAFQLSGGSTLAVFFLGPFATSLALGAVFWLGRETMSLRHGLVMVWLSASVALLYPLSYEFNPNIILLPLWALALVAGWRALQRNALADWVILGLVAGLGMLAKYTFAMALVSIALGAVATRTGRARLRRPWGPGLAILLAVTVTAPHAIAVAGRDYVTLHVAARDTIWEPERLFSLVTFVDLGAFAIGQLAATLPALVAVWLTLRKAVVTDTLQYDRTHSDGRQYLLIVSTLPFLLTVIAGIMGARTRAPWGLPLALLTGPLLVAIWPRLTGLLAPAARQARWTVALALVLPLAGFSLYFAAPTRFGAKNPLREHVDGPAVAALASTYWQRFDPGTPPVVLGLGNGALERQAIGSASLFMAGRPPAYQFFWVVRYGDRPDPELETFILQRDWPWIDLKSVATKGGLGIAVGAEPPMWRRLGFCLGDLESHPLPVARQGYRPQQLWLARLIPSEPNAGNCPPPPPSFRDAMGLGPAPKTMDRFKE
jgi:4-amino-4-deoxy-L-arabinose transferase-like glycosyltransferase